MDALTLSARGVTRTAGPGLSTLVVAELSGNHAGHLAMAHALVDAAADAGADAIKLQTFRPAELAALRGGGRAPAPWEAWSLLELYTATQTPWEWHRDLFEHAADRGLLGFSSTFSLEATRFLLELGVPCLKVAAAEWRQRAALGVTDTVPLICSVPPGGDLEGAGRPPDVALHCPRGYPCSPAGMDLRRGLERLQAVTPLVGLSYHGLWPLPPAVAVGLGACVVEVHLMLERGYARPPLDAAFSLTPGRLLELVKLIRLAEVVR